MKKAQHQIISMGIIGLLLSASFVYAKVVPSPTPVNLAQTRNQKLQAVRQKVSQLKDQTQNKLAESIISQSDHVNIVWTSHFTNVLNQLEGVLGKIKTRRDKARENGENTESVNAAIQKAEAAINRARLAIAVQTTRDYTPANAASIPSTSQTTLTAGLRAQFKDMRDSLFRDLFGLRNGVMQTARMSVQNALNELSKVPNVDKEPSVK